MILIDFHSFELPILEPQILAAIQRYAKWALNDALTTRKAFIFVAKASYQLSAVVKFYPGTQEPNSLTVLQQKLYLQTRWDASVQIYSGAPAREARLRSTMGK